MLVVPDYRGFRIEVVAQFVEAAWNVRSYASNSGAFG
jgi:hypothetical protein